MPFCENCGNKVSDSTKFCSSCGNEIKRQELITPRKAVESHTIIKILKNFLFVVFSGTILLIAFNSKPSFQDHKDTFLNEVLYPLADEVGNEVGIKDLSSIKFLGFGIRDGIKEYVNNSQDLIFKDYYLLSIVESDSIPISFGAFGIVYIPPQVKDEMNKQVKSIIDGTKSLLNIKGKNNLFYEEDRNKNNTNIDKPDALYQQDMPTDTVSIFE